MSDCLFCKIIAGDIPSEKVYEIDDVYAFRDINPVSPMHVLVIPKKHIATINDVQAEDAETMGKLFLAAKQVAKQEGYADAGYRTVVNCGEEGGQVVFHLHMHVIAGRKMRWPPG